MIKIIGLLAIVTAFLAVSPAQARTYAPTGSPEDIKALKEYLSRVVLPIQQRWHKHKLLCTNPIIVRLNTHTFGQITDVTVIDSGANEPIAAKALGCVNKKRTTAAKWPQNFQDPITLQIRFFRGEVEGAYVD